MSDTSMIELGRRLLAVESFLQATGTAQLPFSTIQGAGGAIPVVPAILETVDAVQEIPGLQLQLDENRAELDANAAAMVQLAEDLAANSIDVDLALSQVAEAQKAVSDALAEVEASQVQVGAALELVEQKATAAQQGAVDALAEAELARQAGAAAIAAAGNAQTVADEAASDAAAAASVAQGAQQSAGQAQTAADQAKADALAAAGLAASKGEVITQASAPTGTRANSANLWIRSSDNRPHVWNGSAWVAVTDKVATDAAAAVVTAQSRADAAFTEAVNAATAAGNAMTAANGKNRTWWQTSAPTGTGHATGDTWFNTSAGTINRWSGSAWVSQELGAGALASGAVTEVKIAANAITVAKIANGAIEAGKLATGAVTQEKLATAVANSITTAQSTASSAQTAAGNAQTAADQAAQAASTAQGTANTAAQAAADAAGIAGGKADVLIQSATPAAAMQKATTLWIDTTGGTNTPKRWSGSAWTVVTDKAATDAASAAASAQSTANTAVTNAAAAQTRADNAFTEATNAATAAGNAQTTANGKNTAWYQSSAPAGTGHRVGDLWFNSGSGNAMATWTGSAWTVRQMGANALASNAVTEAKIAANAVTVGKILDGAVQEAKLAASAVTEGKIAAAAVVAGKLAAGAVVAGNIAADAVTAGTIASNAITAREILAGTITAASGIIANAAIGTAQIANAAITDTLLASGIDAGKITVGTLDAGRIAANSITVEKLLVSGGNLIPDASFDGLSQATWTQAGGGSLVKGVFTRGPGVYLTRSSSTERSLTSSEIAISADDQYTVSLTCLTQSGYGGPIRVEVIRVATNGSQAAPIVVATGPTSTNWDTIRGQFTINASTYRSIRIRLVAAAASGTTGNDYFVLPQLIRSSSAEMIVDGAITVDKLAANSVTAAKIVAGTITGTQIAANAITTRELAANSVTATQLVAGTITASSGIIANAAIGSAQIANAAITNTLLASGIDAGKITVGTLDAARIGALSITTGHLAANSITTAKIGANQVTATQIAALTITAAEIAAQTITGAKIAAATITAGLLVADAITARELAADAVVARNIKAGEIVAGKLATDAVVAANIKAGEVTAGKLAANAVVATNIAAGQVTAGKIATDAVVATNIAAGQITTVKIATDAITADKIAAGAVTATSLAADAIDGKTVTGAILRTSATGQRMQFDVNGLRAFDAQGAITASLYSGIGGLSVSGGIGVYSPIGPAVQSSAYTESYRTMVTASGPANSSTNEKAYLQRTYQQSYGWWVESYDPTASSAYSDHAQLRLTLDSPKTSGDRLARIEASAPLDINAGGRGVTVSDNLLVPGDMHINRLWALSSSGAYQRVNARSWRGTLQATPLLTNGSYVTRTATFPAGMFGAIPTVICQSGEARNTVGIQSLSTSSVTIIIANFSGASSASASIEIVAFQ